MTQPARSSHATRGGRSSLSTKSKKSRTSLGRAYTRALSNHKLRLAGQYVAVEPIGFLVSMKMQFIWRTPRALRERSQK